MSEPEITITNVSRNRISFNDGYDVCTVSFYVNKESSEIRIVKDGISYDTGEILKKISEIPMLVEELKEKIVSEVSDMTVKELLGIVIEKYKELDLDITAEDLEKDGTYRINIYAQDLDGNWTQYSD